ncbi:MAG: outer membrane protein [Chromatiales bacterium]
MAASVGPQRSDPPVKLAPLAASASNGGISSALGGGASADALQPSPQRTRGYIALRLGRSLFLDDSIAGDFHIDQSFGLPLYAASLGFNWGSHLAMEVATEHYEGDLEVDGIGKAGEYTVYTIIPQVRLRYPLSDRLTPYLVGGVGLGVSEESDTTSLGASTASPRLSGNDTATIYVAGAGVDYFIADNIAVNLEAKYVMHDIDVRIDGAPAEADLDALLLGAGLRLHYPGPAFEGGTTAASGVIDRWALWPYLGVRVGRPFILDRHAVAGFQFRDEDPDPVAGVSLGTNLGRYLGFELALDQYASGVVSPPGKVGEYDVWNLIPTLRLRYPLLNDRLVPYLLGGIGATYTEENDTTPLAASNASLAFSGAGWSLSGTVGLGTEYFIANNMTVALESKYVITNPDVEAAGTRQDFNLEAVLVSLGLRVFYP